jgi:hypothetical protein
VPAAVSEKPAPKKTLNEKGYVRLWRKPHYGRYEHRVVMAELCRKGCSQPLEEKTGLPEGMVVHHQDHVRTHNCHQNLMLMDKAIHDALSLMHQAHMKKLTEQVTVSLEDQEERLAIQSENLFPLRSDVNFWAGLSPENGDDSNSSRPVSNARRALAAAAL